MTFYRVLKMADLCCAQAVTRVVFTAVKEAKVRAIVAGGQPHACLLHPCNCQNMTSCFIQLPADHLIVNIAGRACLDK